MLIIIIRLGSIVAQNFIGNVDIASQMAPDPVISLSTIDPLMKKKS
jgi:hypothetical protein